LVTQDSIAVNLYLPAVGTIHTLAEKVMPLETSTVHAVRIPK
jgi:hypothetical protein